MCFFFFVALQSVSLSLNLEVQQLVELERICLWEGGSCWKILDLRAQLGSA